MFKRKFYPMLVGAVIAAAVCFAGFNAMAYKDDMSQDAVMKTDATDRTLIKEILANQQIMIGLLKEIRAAQ